jgi:hypothetical protein
MVRAAGNGAETKKLLIDPEMAAVQQRKAQG